MSSQKLQAVALAAGLSVIAVAQTPSDLAAWSNLPVRPARTGHAKPWTRELAIPGSRRAHPRFGWVILNRQVLAYTERRLYAFDSATGRSLWQRAMPFEGDSTEPDGMDAAGLAVLYAPRPDGGTVLVALEPRTGREVWRAGFAGTCRRWQPAGDDLVAEVRRGDSKPGTDPSLGLAILDARTGAWKCRLSPTDGAANRKVLQAKCPVLVDRYVLFGNRRTFNGAYLDGDPGWIDRKAWIFGDSLYVYTSLEDFPMDGLRGDTGLTKHALEGPISADLWAGRAMGRRLNSFPSRHFGEIIGLVGDRLLTSYTTSIARRHTLEWYTAIGTLPTTGAPVFDPIEAPRWGLAPVANASTTLGFVYVTGSKGYSEGPPIPEEEYCRRTFLLTPHGWVAQPPVPHPPREMPPWGEYGVCEDGIVYISMHQNWETPGRMLIHLEPFVVSGRGLSRG